MLVPTKPISLMVNAYRKIFPFVKKELAYWESRAAQIPNPELRKQAVDSIKYKTFHCEGGAIMALMAKDQYKEVIRFIVAYQTISDYLDNLCDRSTSLDPIDFSSLHDSMKDSLSIAGEKKDYYQYRDERDDGNYLSELVDTCQEVLRKSEHYEKIHHPLLELCSYYCDLQVHKHVTPNERVPRLQNWHTEKKQWLPEMEWYEFSACSGSTLGIFCLVSYAFNPEFKEQHIKHIREGYFPYIQGLHILLDYLIDQEEDKREGDLNFCFYYENEQQLFSRLKHFITESDRHTKKLPYRRFHQLINRGLLGLYLSDMKVRRQENVRKLVSELIKAGGFISFFFYINAIVYRKMKVSGKTNHKDKKKLARYAG